MTDGRSTRTVIVSGIHDEARRRVVRILSEAAPGATASQFDPARATHRGEGPLRIVELPGGTDPAIVAEALMSSDRGGTGTTLAGVVTAVDAQQCVTDLASGEIAHSRGLSSDRNDPRTTAETLLRQVDYADHLALVGAGRADLRGRLCLSLLAHLNPSARLLAEPSPHELAPLFGRCFDGVDAAARLSPAFPPLPPHTEEDLAETVVWRRFRPLHPERFFEALDETASAGLRSRGRLWLAGMPDAMLSWEAVGLSLSFERSGPWLAALPAGTRRLAAELRRPTDTFDWHPRTGDRRQHIAFTGLGVDTPRLLPLLDSCLLTDDEVLAWERDGPLCENPFAPLLESDGGSDC
ncbi:GTP-binding protein [Nocardiopsis synnemataformans]|uniref:GTP-binding protein n=1 Tax=Nocardiopsis synnemataformans TaxID=61305 RepID=UPI003EB7C1FF